MSARMAARLGWSLLVLSVLLVAAALVLNLGRPQYADLAFTTGELLLQLVLLLFGWFGARIVSRQPNHRIGWLLCAISFLTAMGGFATEYAIYGLISHPGAAPGAEALAWFMSWLSSGYLALFAALLALFPTGRPPSPRWRWVLWLAGSGVACALLGALWLWPLRGVALLQLPSPEPVGLPGLLYIVGSWAPVLAVLAAVASLAVRFRRSQGAERQQLKWLAYAGVVVVLCFVLPEAAAKLLGSQLAGDLVFAALFAPVPVAVGIAILKYHLYDIDRLVNRTLVYGLLTALLGGVYTGAVLVLGQLFGGVTEDPPSWAVAGATLAVAALFQPARHRIQAVVDRRFNRRKYDAAKTVEAFSVRLRDEVDLVALSAELLAVADQTMQPTTMSLWLRPSTPVPAGRQWPAS
jgi:MFS family permease